MVGYPDFIGESDGRSTSRMVRRHVSRWGSRHERSSLTAQLAHQRTIQLLYSVPILLYKRSHYAPCFIYRRDDRLW
jgi:hypothetical protein